MFLPIFKTAVAHQSQPLLHILSPAAFAIVFNLGKYDLRYFLFFFFVFCFFFQFFSLSIQIFSPKFLFLMMVEQSSKVILQFM